MPRRTIQSSFTIGELAPKLIGRTRLPAYDEGLSYAKNWFIDYNGGISTRPGTGFAEFVQYPDQPTRTFRFQYSPDTSNAYLILFGDGYIRFLQNKAYVTEAAKNITGVSQAAEGVVTSNAHGYSDGDWIQIASVGGMTELNSRTFEVASATANTFKLIDVRTNTLVNTTGFDAYTSGGTAKRIYTLTHDYNAADLAALQARQIRDYIRLTHPDYPTQNLIRAGHTSWTLEDEEFGNSLDRPTGLAVSFSSNSTLGVLYAVTALFSDGSESIPSNVLMATNAPNLGASVASAKLTWTKVAGARFYNVYRSVVYAAGGTNLTIDAPLGFVGRVAGNRFTDAGVTPDFTIVPPEYANPFEDGAITDITITSNGSLYTSAPSVSVSGGSGTGFVGEVIYDPNTDTVEGVKIIKPGRNYTSPTVSFTGGGGSGAAASATASAIGGNDPATSAIFQQRQVYGGTRNQPLALFGSKTGLYSLFDTSQYILASDGFEFEIDSNSVSLLRHLVPVRGGLMILTAVGVWLFSGANTTLVTPTDAQAEPQNNYGCSLLPPLVIDSQIFYQTSKEKIVRALSYSDYSKLYGGKNLSHFSNHLFPLDNPVVAWDFAAAPNRLVHAVRQDGTALLLAVVLEENSELNIIGWTQSATEGFYRDVTVLEEDGNDTVYYTVERYIDGVKVKFIEYVTPRVFTNVEDVVCLDAALSLPVTYPAATIEIAVVGEAPSGTATITASASVFSAGDVGSVLRVGRGKIVITGYTSGTVVTGTVRRNVEAFIPETTTIKPLGAGEWSLDAPSTVVGGLWHLEGMSVSVLADGSVQPPRTVSNGQITLDSAASRVTVGLPYVCEARSLPVYDPNEINDSSRKVIKGVGLRMYETRGLLIGNAEASNLYPMRDRSTEYYGEPVQPRTGMVFEVTDSQWDNLGMITFRQADPLPATILGLVKEIEVGDDPR